jgi:hypothetical protein
VLLQQRSTLTFGHTAPNSEFNPVVEGVGAALCDHRAVPANHRSLALGGAANEQLVRVGRSAQSLGYPRDPGLAIGHFE